MYCEMVAASLLVCRSKVISPTVSRPRAPERSWRRPDLAGSPRQLDPQQFLYFLPLPQGHGSFLPGFCAARTEVGRDSWGGVASWLWSRMSRPSGGSRVGSSSCMCCCCRGRAQSLRAFGRLSGEQYQAPSGTLAESGHEPCKRGIRCRAFTRFQEQASLGAEDQFVH